MALVSSALSAAIKAKFIAKKGAPANDAALTDFCDSVAEAVVEYLTANATVTPTALVAPAGGGAVTGTGKIS